MSDVESHGERRAIKITEQGDYVEVDPVSGEPIPLSPEMAELGELIKEGLNELQQQPPDTS